MKEPHQSFFQKKVADYMNRDIVSVGPETSLRDVSKLFEKYDFNTFPVIEGEKLVGVFSKFDFMRAFAFTDQHPLPDYHALMATPVRDMMSEELNTVRPDMPLTRVLQAMVEKRTRSLPVLDQGKIVGVISREDIMRALAESTATFSEFSSPGAQSRILE